MESRARGRNIDQDILLYLGFSLQKTVTLARISIEASGQDDFSIKVIYLNPSDLRGIIARS